MNTRQQQALLSAALVAVTSTPMAHAWMNPFKGSGLISDFKSANAQLREAQPQAKYPKNVLAWRGLLMRETEQIMAQNGIDKAHKRAILHAHSAVRLAHAFGEGKVRHWMPTYFKVTGAKGFKLHSGQWNAEIGLRIARATTSEAEAKRMVVEAYKDGSLISKPGDNRAKPGAKPSWQPKRAVAQPGA